MIKLNQIINDNQRAILTIFAPKKLQSTQKEIEKFNKKTADFLESARKITIKL